MAEAMIDHLHGEPGLDVLAANPLLLTAMCVVYDEDKCLPAVGIFPRSRPIYFCP